MKAQYDVGEHKVKRTQAKQGEDVGRIDDVGVARDGKDSRNRIERENEISRFDQYKGNKHRCGQEFAMLAH